MVAIKNLIYKTRITIICRGLDACVNNSLLLAGYFLVHYKLEFYPILCSVGMGRRKKRLSAMKVSLRDILYGFEDREEERLFVFDYFRRFKTQVRMGILIAIFIYLVFYFIDIYVFPELEPHLLINRLFITSIFALIFGLSFTRYFARYMQCFLLFFGIVAALGILWKLHLLNANGYDFSFFYPGLILTSAIVTFYMRVRFVHSALLNLFVIASYVVLFVFYIHPVPDTSRIDLNQTFVNSLFFIVGSSFLSLYGAYYLEIITRNEYLTRLHINQLNSNLEIVVEQRTTELEDEKRKNISRLLEGQEKERERISKELHDGVCCQLALIKMNLEALKQPIELSDLSQPLAAIENLARDVHDISHNQSVFILQSVGLPKAIESSLYQMLSRCQAHFNVYFHQINGGLPAATQLMLYRVFQEALNNIVKHAQATEVDIQLVQHDDQLSFVVADNGKGFNVTNGHPGLGLHNMRMRIENQLQGQLIIDSAPGYGTTIIVNLKSEEP